MASEHREIYRADSNKKSTSIIRVLKLAAKRKVLFSIFVILIFLSVAMQLAVPVMIQRCINLFIMRDSMSDFAERIMGLLTILFGLFVASLIFEYIKNLIAARLSEQIAFNIRNELYNKLIYMPVSFTDRYSYGDMMSRLTNDLTKMNSILQLVELFLSKIVIIIGAAVLMLTQNVTLALISIVTAVVATFASAMFSKVMFGLFIKQREYQGELNAHVEETFKNPSTIRNNGLKYAFINKMHTESKKYYNISKRASVISAIINPVMLILGNAGFLATVIFGSGLAIDKVIALGTLQAVIMYSKQFTDSVFQFSNIFVQAQEMSAGAKRVFEILDYTDKEFTLLSDKTTVDNADAVDNDCIVFDNVSFGYYDETDVLKNISLVFKRGTKNALVGSTGAGKSTIISLIMGFYSQYKGSIKLDGAEMSSISQSQLHTKISAALQETAIISSTIKDNISYGMNINTDEIDSLARLLGIDKFTGKKDYLNTVISDSSDNLSGGQKQIIALARALIRKPSVLILDEALSGVDFETEMQIIDKIHVYNPSCTLITVAHRLEAIRNYDTIFVIDNGTVAQSGSHDSLMMADGVYKFLTNNEKLGLEL